MNHRAALFALIVLAACDNKSSGAPPAASSAAPPPTAASSAASVAPSASASASATANASWAGTFKSGAGTLSLPVGKGFEGATWANDDGGAGVGDGTLSIDVDGATGVVSGSGEGVLGAIVLDGIVKDGQLSATISRKNSSDRGFTGTLLGKVAGEKIEGTMSLSLPEATGLRKATFTLAKK